jgi:hypothetical protein
MADVVTNEGAPADGGMTTASLPAVDNGPDSPAALAANANSEDIDIIVELAKLSKIPSALRSIAPFLEESYGILL